VTPLERKKNKVLVSYGKHSSSSSASASASSSSSSSSLALTNF
jgi:hypothetical protein